MAGSDIEDRLMQGMGCNDERTVTDSPGFRIWEACPSMDTADGARLRSPIRRVIEEEAGNTSGRKDRLRGQIGVRTRALSDG